MRHVSSGVRMWPRLCAAIRIVEIYTYPIAVYGLLLIASNLFWQTWHDCITYIRPLELAHVETVMGAVAYHRNKKSQGLLLAQAV